MIVKFSKVHATGALQMKFSVIFHRTNLFYEVRRKKSSAKAVTEEIADFINTNYPKQCGIIYCFSKKVCLYEIFHSFCRKPIRCQKNLRPNLKLQRRVTMRDCPRVNVIMCTPSGLTTKFT